MKQRVKAHDERLSSAIGAESSGGLIAMLERIRSSMRPLTSRGGSRPGAAPLRRLAVEFGGRLCAGKWAGQMASALTARKHRYKGDAVTVVN